MNCTSDDAPCKNWDGVADYRFPRYMDISAEPVKAQQERKYGCWRCPVGCGGIMKEGTGEFKYDGGCPQAGIRNAGDVRLQLSE